MTRSIGYLPVLVTLLLLVSPASTRGWVVAPELGYGRSIAITPAGDVLTCGISKAAAGYDFSVRL